MRAAPVSKTETVYRVLVERIGSGYWPVGECIPTEFELAAELDCGRHTVSQAITRLMHEGMVERRRRAGTRVLRSSVRSIKSTVKLDAFAFIYPSDRHEGVWRIVNGFQDAARQNGRRVVTLTMGTDYEKEVELVSRLAEFDVKAAALYPLVPLPSIQMRLSAMLVESKFPIVLTELNLPGLGRPSVIVDNFHAGYSMTKHLIETGISKIGFLANSSWSPTVVERYRGFLWAHEEADKEVAGECVLMEPEMRPNFDDPLHDPILLGRRYIKANKDVEGVVAVNDFLAQGLIVAAQEKGIRIPEDLKVTGMDDFAAQARGDIPLTTYHVPFEELGRKVFETLDALLHKRSSLELETRIRGEVVVRGSA